MEIWLVISISLLVLMIIGIALVYCGSVRFKNALSSLCFTFLLFPPTYILWKLFGERIIFGDAENLLLVPNTYAGEVLPDIYFLFQFLFCFISVLVLWGSTLERVSFRFVLAFSSLWLLAVYSPVARWVLNESGWLHKAGALDFAGGFTVHMTSGFSALVLANCVGRRHDYFQLKNKFSQPMIFLGTFLIWLGWFGFNAGSSIVFNEDSVVAFVATFCAGVGAIGMWCLLDFIHTPNRVTMTGISLGLVSGLVAVTPAAGFVTSLEALVIGILAGFFCNYSSRYMHKVFKVDDTIDVFPSHGIGGLVGALATGWIVLDAAGVSSHFQPNLIASAAVAGYSMLVTWLLVKVLGKLMPIRISKKHEEEGSDVRLFGENILNLK